MCEQEADSAYGISSNLRGFWLFCNTIKKIQEKQVSGAEPALKANAEDETAEHAVCDQRSPSTGRLENYNQQYKILK